jgi:hypothetical protein
MTQEKLIDAITELDSDILDRYFTMKNELASKKKPTKHTWVKWASVAACFCLVLTAIICIPMINNDGKIISIFKTNNKEDALYPIPLPGECIFFFEVEQARKEYMGKDVQFLIAFKVFKDGNDEISGGELAAEYQRLADLGYKLYYIEDHWTYRGGGVKEYIPIVVGLFTEEELNNFAVNEKYGYTFKFERNGDGSSIKIDEKDVITDFESFVTVIPD